MLGFTISFTEYWKTMTPCHKALQFFLEQLPTTVVCYSTNYELVVEEKSISLAKKLTKEDLLYAFSGDYLLTNGAFFFYPAQATGGPLDTWEAYLASPCQAAVLVHDVGFFEIYSKEEQYLQKCLTFLNQMGPDVEVEIIEESNRFRDSFAL